MDCLWSQKGNFDVSPKKSMVVIPMVVFLFSSHGGWVYDGSLELKRLKLIFHQKRVRIGYPTPDMKLTTPTRHQHESAQCKLYSTCSHWGSCWALHKQSACVMPNARKKHDFFCFFCFFLFSTGLVQPYIAGLPLRSCQTIGAPFVQGSAQSLCFRFW